MPEYVEIFGVFVKETEMAVLILNEFKENIWIPKSVIADWIDGITPPNEEIEIEIELWFAIKEGLV